jgi:hypothetical protein
MPSPSDVGRVSLRLICSTFYPEFQVYKESGQGLYAWESIPIRASTVWIIRCVPGYMYADAGEDRSAHPAPPDVELQVLPSEDLQEGSQVDDE